MPVINSPKGFTLVELIIGIIVFAIGIGIVTVLVVPSAGRSVDPIMQVRAAELAQSLLNEISARSFDEESDRLNGQIRCNEDLSNPPDGDADDTLIGERTCTDETLLGADGETRDDFDDVDDYHGMDQTGANILNSVGQGLTVDGRNLYDGFRAEVDVFYDSDFDGQADVWALSENTKHIRITITTPTNQQYVFSTYRSNF